MDEMQIPERSRRPFFVSLYQFISPAVGVDVDGGLHRLMNESVLSVVDESVYQDLDAPLDSAGLSRGEKRQRPPSHQRVAESGAAPLIAKLAIDLQRKGRSRKAERQNISENSKKIVCFFLL